MKGRKRGKRRSNDKVKGVLPNTSDRMAKDEESLQNSTGKRESFWWRCIKFPSTLLDLFMSSILRLQLYTYQKVAGRSPLFLKDKDVEIKDAGDKNSDLERKGKKLADNLKILQQEKIDLVVENQVQVDKIEKQEGEIKELQQLVEENKVLVDKIEKKNGEIKELQHEKSDLLDENKVKVDTIEKQDGQIKELRHEKSDLVDENKVKVDKIEKQDREIKGLQQEKSDLEEKNKEQAGINKHLNEGIKELQDKNSDLEKKNKEEKDTNKKLEEENKDQAVKNKTLDDQNVKIECLNKGLQHTNEEQSKRIHLQNNEIEILHKKIESLENDKFVLQNKLKDEKHETSELRDVKQKLTEEKRLIEEEKLDALRRLSEQVSVKLRDNNPNIVDLSDQCRPTKLAEMFSELYDNEWTNAFSVLEDNLTEEQAIMVLLDTVMIAYGFCETKVNEPWEILTDWFIDENLPGVQQTMKWLKDSRKANIPKKVSETKKNFNEAILRMCGDESLKSLLSDNDIHVYFTKCIELCLLMVATDPPVVLVCPGWKVIHTAVDDRKPQHEHEESNTNQMMEGHTEPASNTGSGPDVAHTATVSNTSTEQGDDPNKFKRHTNAEQDGYCIETAGNTNTEQDDDGYNTANHTNADQNDDHIEATIHTNTEQADDRNGIASHGNTELNGDRNDSASHINTEQDGGGLNAYQKESACHINAAHDESHNESQSHTNADHGEANTEGDEEHCKTASNTNEEQNGDQNENETRNNVEQGQVEYQKEEELNLANTDEQKAINKPQLEDEKQPQVMEDQDLKDIDSSTGQVIINNDVSDRLLQPLRENKCQENDQEADKEKMKNDNHENIVETESKEEDLQQIGLVDYVVINGESVQDTEQEGKMEVQNAQRLNRTDIVTNENKCPSDQQPQQQAVKQVDTEFDGKRETDDGEQHEGEIECVTIPHDRFIHDNEISCEAAEEEDSEDIVDEGKMIHRPLENDAVITDNKNGDSIVTNDTMKKETQTLAEEIPLFDKEFFKEYTKRGKYLDYIVWPAMCLHKDGPLLSKGVAQGRKDQHAVGNGACWTWTNKQ